MVIVAEARLEAWRRPLARPIVTARGAVSERRGLWLVLRDAAGREGVGECAPLPVFSVETLAEARAALAGLVRGGSSLTGRELGDAGEIGAAVAALGWPAAAAHAVDQALLELLAAERGVPVWRLLAEERVEPDRGPVESHALVADAAQARAAVLAGARVLKLKVGDRALAEDVARVAAVRAAVGPEVRLRLDANGAWDAVTAPVALREAAALGVELVEEPLAGGDLAGLAALRRASAGVAIAVDESCRSAGALEAVVAAGAADVVVLKPMLIGGPSAASAMARRAVAAGLGVMITTSLDGAVARRAAEAVARAVPGPAGAVHGVGPGGSVDAAPRGEGAALPEPLAAAARWRPGHAAVVMIGGARVGGKGEGEGEGRGVDPVADPDPVADADPVAGPVAGERGGEGEGERGREGEGAGERERERGGEGEGERGGEREREGERGGEREGERRDLQRMERVDLAIAARRLESVTWGELERLAGRCAAALAADGVLVGDVVALEGLGGIAGVAALWGVFRAGAAALPLGARSTPAERAAALAVALPDHRVDAEALVARARECEPAPERDWPLDEVRLIVLSGGTTGAPRPVPLTGGQLAFAAFGSALRLGHAADDRWLVPLPLDHVGGLSVLLRTAFGATTALVQHRFDPVTAAHALDSGEATLASFVPEMLARVLDARPSRPFPASVRALLVGGAAAPEALVARCRALGAPVALSWGMTETAAQVATRAPGDLAPDGGVGTPLATARVHTDASGRLVVRGPQAPGGHHASADEGAVDAAGRVHVRGRTDDVIVSGGEKIDPAEVEAALRAHPAVAEALVAGLPDDRWGARPVAALVAAHGAEPPADDALRAWLGERLAGFKRPDRFLWVPDLPRTPLGKPSRAALTALASRPAGGAP